MIDGDPPDTIFSGIIRGEIPADIVYQDEACLAFRDINPQAETHVLVIPRRPIVSLSHITKGDRDLIGHLLAVCARVAASEGVSESGYRVVTNVGRDGGQTVEHLHFHILGGRPLGWPPG